MQADGTLSNAVSLSNYVEVIGPVGGLDDNQQANYHPILQSARIPLGDFGATDLTKIRGVRFVFDGTPKGAIYVANIRLSTIGIARSSPPAIASNSFSRGSSGGSTAMASRSVHASPMAGGAAVGVPVHHTRGNAITGIRDAAQQEDGEDAAVEVELRSDEKFLVGDALPILQIGERRFSLSHQPDGDTHRMAFTIRINDFEQLPDGGHVTVHLGKPDAGDHWTFGRFDKRVLRRR